MTSQCMDIKELGKRGKALYEERIRPLVEEDNTGKYVTMDVESGDWEMGDNLLDVADRLQARHPDTVFFTVRVGCRAKTRMGCSSTNGDPVYIASHPQMTVEELARRPDTGGRRERMDRESMEASEGLERAMLAARLARLLGPPSDNHGWLAASSLVCRMANGSVRSPDVSFLKFERLPEGVSVKGFFQGAPDLCIQIVLPLERPSKVQQELGEYFESGARQVWHMFPEKKRLVVYRSLDNVQSYGADEELDAGDILPGFRCTVGNLFFVPTRRVP